MSVDSRYRPKQSSKRWLEGAPAAVLACYDSGPNRGADRYTVLYGAPLWDASYGRNVPGRAMSEAPFSPIGIGLYIEIPAYDRSGLGRKIKFADLPDDCRRCVEMDCAESADA